MTDLCLQIRKQMGRKLLKTVQTITTFRNPPADPMGTRRGTPLVRGPQFENRWSIVTMSLAVTVWPQIAMQIFGTPFWERGRAQRVDDSTVR